MIVILFTGGTIAMRNDPTGAGAQPALTPAEILQATRGIRAITAVETEEWGQFPGPHMTVERMWALRNRIVEHLARPEVTGVVITHGTDTLEESAYLVSRSTASEKPIVFTGAMRTVSDLGWDGPANLFEAVQVAASPETRGFGVMVVIGGQIFAALDATKTNTHLLDAFESPGLGPLGVLVGSWRPYPPILRVASGIPGWWETAQAEWRAELRSCRDLQQARAREGA